MERRYYDPYGIPAPRITESERVTHQQQRLMRQTGGTFGTVIQSYGPPVFVPPSYGIVVQVPQQQYVRAYPVPHFDCKVCGCPNHKAHQCPWKPAGMMFCQICQGQGHTGRGCPSAFRLGSLVGTCSKCGRSDHSQDACQDVCQCSGCRSRYSHQTAWHRCGKCGGDGHSTSECIS